MSNKTKQDLECIGFENIGTWQLKDNSLSYRLDAQYQSYLQIPNVLYAFCNNNCVKYIGKTTRSIKKRFIGYMKPGNSQQTNKKCNGEIIEILNARGTVEIWAFGEASSLQWAGYDINLPAGLEDALIQALRPDWNRTLPKTRTDYSDLVELPAETELEGENLPPLDRECRCSFGIQLGRTYYNTGSINPGAKASKCLGEHGRRVIIYLGSMQNSLSSTINREANANGSVRIVGNNGQIRDWFQANFNQDDTVNACVLSKHEIFLREKHD